MKLHQNAFSLIEIMVVVVMITIIAGFAMASFQKALDRAEERQTILNLRTLQSGIKIYRARTGKYPDFPISDIANINSTFNLSILESNQHHYSCVLGTIRSPNLDFGCYANGSSSPGWSLGITFFYTPPGTLIQENGPYCSGADPCPSCTPAGCPGN